MPGVHETPLVGLPRGVRRGRVAQPRRTADCRGGLTGCPEVAAGARSPLGRPGPPNPRTCAARSARPLTAQRGPRGSRSSLVRGGPPFRDMDSFQGTAPTRAAAQGADAFPSCGPANTAPTLQRGHRAVRAFKSYYLRSTFSKAAIDSCYSVEPGQSPLKTSGKGSPLQMP